MIGMKTILILAGLVILSIGVFVMKGLIGMKEPPPVTPRLTSKSIVKMMDARLDTLAPTVQIEGRVQALNRMTVIAEVSGFLPVGGKEFRDGVAFEEGEPMLRVDDSELRASLVAQRSQWLQLLVASFIAPDLHLVHRCG